MLAGLLLLGGTLAAGAYLVWRFARTPRPRWLDVPGFMLVRCAVPDGVRTEDVGRALRLSLDALTSLGPWSALRLQAVTARLDVYVMDVDAWTDGWGRKVGGLQLGRTLTVGRSLAGLCHEVAHLAESTLDGAPDETHISWGARGLHAAVAEYQRRLNAGDV